MAENSAIEWTDATWNPTRGCTKIAPGCAHCYAETFAERFRGVPGHPYEQGFDPRIAPDKLTEPLKWKKPKRIFVDSMSDLFHEAFDFSYIARVFAVMWFADRHTYQLLTKRIERAVMFFLWYGSEHADRECFHDSSSGVGFADLWQCDDCGIIYRTVEDQSGPIHVGRGDGSWFSARNEYINFKNLPNVWFGTSIANQPDADKNIPELLKIPAAVRFVSVEPLIDSVDLAPWSPSAICECGHAETKHYGPAPFDNYQRTVGCQAGDGSAENPICGCRKLRGEKTHGLGDPYRNHGVHWVIVGGESGPGARPCNVEWIRLIIEQCKAASVPCFVKQLGAKPYQRCSNCGRNVGRGFIGGFADACGPTHALLIAEMVRIHASKGGDWNEWPADLRIREFPG